MSAQEHGPMKEPAKPLPVPTTDEVAPSPTTYDPLSRLGARQLTSKDVLRLQRTVGNRATQKLLSNTPKSSLQRKHITDEIEGIKKEKDVSGWEAPLSIPESGETLNYPMKLYSVDVKSPSYQQLMVDEAQTLAYIGNTAPKKRINPKIKFVGEDAEYPMDQPVGSKPTTSSRKKESKAPITEEKKTQETSGEKQKSQSTSGYSLTYSADYWPFAIKIKGSWGNEQSDKDDNEEVSDLVDTVDVHNTEEKSQVSQTSSISIMENVGTQVSEKIIEPIETRETEPKEKQNSPIIDNVQDVGTRNIEVTFSNAAYGYTMKVEGTGEGNQNRSWKAGNGHAVDEFAMKHGENKATNLSEKARLLNDKEAGDAASKVISEGARWISVRKAAEQGKLYDDTKFYADGIYLDQSPVKYVTFKKLWNSWQEDFGNAWDISEQDLIKKIDQGFSKGKLVLSQSTSNQGRPKNSGSQPNKGQLKKGKLEQNQDEVNPEETKDQDAGYGTVAYATLKQDPHTYAIPSIGDPQAHAAVREFLAGPLSGTMEKQKSLNGLAIKLNLYPPEDKDNETSEGGTSFQDTFALVNIYRDLLSTDEKKKGNAFYTLVHELGLHALTMEKSDVTKNNERALQEHNAIIDPNAVVNPNELAPKEVRTIHVKTNAEKKKEKKEKMKPKKGGSTSTNKPTQTKAVKPDIPINFFNDTVKPATQALFENDSFGEGRNESFPTADSFLRQFVNDIKDTLSFMACNFLCSKGCDQVEINSQYETHKKLGHYVVRLNQGLLMLDQVLEFCISCVNDHAPWTHTVKKIKQLKSTLSTQATQLKDCDDKTPLENLIKILAPELLSESEDDGLDAIQSTTKEDSVRTIESDSETGNETPTSLKQNEKTTKKPELEGVIV